MAWRDTLIELKAELAEIRTQRQQQAKEDQAEIDRQRTELTHLANTLQISQLLEEMNTSLLDGTGKVEQDISSEPVEGDAEDSDLDELDVEEADVISAFRIWEDRELVVDLGISDNGTYLQVNNVDIRPEREALEQALLEGFRDELDV